MPVVNPTPWHDFGRGPRPSLERIESAVYQALGAASLCWTGTPTGVFDSVRAKQIGDDLVAFINEGKVPTWLS